MRGGVSGTNESGFSRGNHIEHDERYISNPLDCRVVNCRQVTPTGFGERCQARVLKQVTPTG
jgi:hypothetical protein